MQARVTSAPSYEVDPPDAGPLAWAWKQGARARYRQECALQSGVYRRETASPSLPLASSPARSNLGICVSKGWYPRSEKSHLAIRDEHSLREIVPRREMLLGATLDVWSVVIWDPLWTTYQA